MDPIAIRGAREHNLQGIDLDLPRNALTVITGVSGSGKSSLAFDTLYQEGQRRFLESLSAYARQFLGQMERPKVDRVEGITPTLSIDQKTVNRNPRSTVGTVTELYDHFRLLYARLGEPHCPVCDRTISRSSPTDLADRLLHDHDGKRLQILAPLVRDRKGEYRKELEEWLAQGWLRARIDGEICSLEEPISLARYEKHTIELVIDRIVLSTTDRPRLVEAIERAVKLTKGMVSTLIGEDYALHAVERSCPVHGISVPELEPRLFSFNAPQGACPSCGGLGLKTTEESTFLRPVYTICTACNGRRLNPIALAVRFRQYTIDQMVHLPVEDARRFFDSLSLDEREQRIGETLLKEIQDRLRFLDEVGLGYLNLDRRSNSLSGGEAQRIRLAACVGSRLQGVTYVLDEPSIGLHPRDNGRLIDALFALRDIGNTVVVVEHDRETMERADHIVDIGPGAGRFGGRLTGQGDPGHFVALDTPTARFLRDELTGVSGSGKSTLMTEELEPRVQKVLAAKRGEEEKEAIKWKIPGAEQLDKLIEIDQQPIGRTPRSNPATYSGAFDLIRDLFAASPEAAARGYAKGRFSFNVPGGRCEACEGAGVRTIEMQFLADVEVPCEACEGRRFNAETLEIRWKGLSIAEVLKMTVGEAAEFFKAHPKLSRILNAMVMVGLDYVALGQSATTLSGGEAQRLKLAAELQRPPTGHTLYLLDEPTTGLHFQDVAVLIRALQALVDAGNTVLIIEHNTDIIKVADHLIELGPEGGKAGGRLVATGSPEQLARTDTNTGRVLAEMPEFGGHRPLFASDRAIARYGDGGQDLVIEGARCHNLKGVSLTIPRGKTTVITGRSGSGKTSLAFDTIFAEGQRRYVEALSTYARRFLGRLERPQVDKIHGLAPAIAIDQKNSAHNPRSTVATVTEIQDHLRLLWANLGVPHCPHCDAVIRPLPPGMAAELLQHLAPGKGRLLAKVPKEQTTAELRKMGFSRGFFRGKEVELEEVEKVTEVVIDRLDPATTDRSRIAESVALAYRIGKTRFLPAAGTDPLPLQPLPECPDHGKIHKDPLTPRHFSFNHYLGACPACNGLGREEWSPRPCTRCKGARLKPEILAVRFGGKGMGEVGAMTVEESLAWFSGLQLSPNDALVADQPLREVRNRLGFLRDVGLEYLSLDRAADTLSGGESQRIRLASQLGSGLTGCIYVLDEPTVGLHPRDTRRLLESLDGLRKLGNTLVIVEHDLETMRRADLIVDMGPEAGDRGGEIVDIGPPEKLNDHSVTGPWLSGRRSIATPLKRRAGGPPIRLRKATKHNLRDLDVDLPTGLLLGVTGVSGSGKSSLVMDLLVGALSGKTEGVAVEGAAGWELAVVDQAPIGLSPRSSPATYLGGLDPIRELFTKVPLAAERGYGVGRFSYNSAEGACRHCGGHGQEQVEMHFLSNVWVRCDGCKGRRYNRETLDVRWKGLSIADILELRVDDALSLFDAHRRIRRPLQALADVGLGYLRLGQPATELSGGEAQRIKLATGLGTKNKTKSASMCWMSPPPACTLPTWSAS